MQIPTRTAKVVFWLSLVVWATLLLLPVPLPSPAGVLDVVNTLEPKQEETREQPFRTIIGGFTYAIEPLFAYDLHGLVVTLHDAESWLDIVHRDDPGNARDLCVVWGQNSRSGSYRLFSYSSGEFTCFFSLKRPPPPGTINPDFAYNAISNNHLIPANERVRNALKSVVVGDQVRFSGFLARYRVRRDGQFSGSRGSSTTREDMGDGACETVYVKEFEVLKRGPGWYLVQVRKGAGWMTLAALGVLVWNFLREVREAERMLGMEEEPKKSAEPPTFRM